MDSLAVVLVSPVLVARVVGAEVLEDTITGGWGKAGVLLLKVAPVVLLVEILATLEPQVVVMLMILAVVERLARPRQQLQARVVMGAQALVAKAVAVAVAVVLLLAQEALAGLGAILQVVAGVEDVLLTVLTLVLAVLAVMVYAVSTLGKELT
jgi:hypothetical protein